MTYHFTSLLIVLLAPLMRVFASLFKFLRRDLDILSLPYELLSGFDGFLLYFFDNFAQFLVDRVLER